MDTNGNIVTEAGIYISMKSKRQSTGNRDMAIANKFTNPTNTNQDSNLIDTDMCVSFSITVIKYLKQYNTIK